MQRVTRIRLASLAVLVLVLASGVVLGRAWERRSGAEDQQSEEVRRDVRAADDRRDDDRGDGRKDGRRGRRLIVDRVELTPAQEVQVDSIVDVHVGQVRSLQRELQDRFEAEYEPRERAIVSDTRNAIRAVLTVEQRERYDSLLSEHDRKRRDDGDHRRGR